MDQASTRFVSAVSSRWSFMICMGVTLPLMADPIVLTDVTEKTGITFQHTDGSRGNYYIVEYVSSGLALFDYDNDGDIDIYFLNGAFMNERRARSSPKNSLYRNDGNWRFTDVTSEAGVGDTGHGLGVTVGDYDNDGLDDLYINNFGPNVLYRNQGDGSFVDQTTKANVGNGNKVGAGVCFLDMDQDGDLDLYVANYLKFSLANHRPRTKQGNPIYGSPLEYLPEADTLYRNNGDGTFSDVSRASGIARKIGFGMGTVCCDYDNDGDTDIIVGNDTGANFLFRNNGRGQFQEVGLLSGIAYDGTGTIQGTMGIDCADFDNDGFFDFHVTSYQNELATLYRNIGGAFLEDVSKSSGVARGTSAPVTWGNGFVDFDNDGNRDLFIACGHLYDNVDRFDDSSSYHAKNLVQKNLGNGKFQPLQNSSGDGLAVKLSSRGAGFDDLDNDGDIDVVVLNSRREPTLLRNDSHNENGWISLQLTASGLGRNAVGARVEITAGGKKYIDEVRSGRGYQGHFGSRLHFGLGAAKKVDTIRVSWPNGKSEIHRSIPANRIYAIPFGGQPIARKQK